MAKSKKISAGSKQAGGLYQDSKIRQTPRLWKPSYYVVSSTPDAVTQYDRIDQVKMARVAFSKMPDLGGAIIQKNQWVVSAGAFCPVYTGTDTQWGEKAEKWLIETFYPMCSTMGPNYNFQTLLYLSSIALDVDGDTGLLLTSATTGFPQVGLIPSHRIGQRNQFETIVKGGSYDGYKIQDGVITNSNGRPIAYRILGEKIDGSQDVDISANDLQLLFEPEWSDQQRGISRIARSIADWEDQNDINDFLLRQVKLASSIGLKHKTEDGTGNGSGFDVGVEEDVGTLKSGVQVTPINGGEIYFMKAAVGEDIETLKNENPSPNTEAFIARIQKRAMYSIGWQQELLDPSKIGGASVRLIQDLTRKSISSRQSTIEKRAKLIVNYAIAKAIKLGYLPPNKEWFKWSFTKGAMLSCDFLNENKADIENLKIGSTTLANICSKNGNDWMAIRNQSQREVEDLITRAMAISTKTGRPYEECLVLLQQNTPNQSPTATPVAPPVQEASNQE